MREYAIKNVKHTFEDGFSKLSAEVDGTTIYLRTPESFELTPSSEWFLATGLLDAMVDGRTIVIDSDYPISQRLHENLYELQSVYKCWNGDLSIVDVNSVTSNENRSFTRVGSTYSGGIDSSYTLQQKLSSLSHLFIGRSFDKNNGDESWYPRIAKMNEFASSLGKTLVPFETNVRDWSVKDRKIAWVFNHGLILSAIGTPFGLRTAYVPSTHTYRDLFPWGSHPVSDRLWGTESTEVIHHGAAARRTEKTIALFDNPQLFNNVQVCWEETARNCGECSKCLRTMLVLYIFDVECNTLPKLTDLKKIENFKPGDANEASFILELMHLAYAKKKHKLHKMLRSNYNQFQRRQIVHILDRHMLGNFMKKLYRMIKTPSWADTRVGLYSKSRWDQG